MLLSHDFVLNNWNVGVCYTRFSTLNLIASLTFREIAFSDYRLVYESDENHQQPSRAFGSRPCLCSADRYEQSTPAAFAERFVHNVHFEPIFS
jgi:hypothetical protein